MTSGYLVPLLFEVYAADLATRLRSKPIGSLLELAAGTGVLTRALAAALPEQASIVATDINQAMLDEAATHDVGRRVEWREADAMALPFAAATFDAVVCQFGVMFFPDKANAFAEARRVLKPGGLLLFNVWDRIETNEFSDIVVTAVALCFPADPPGFLTRTPYAYHDRATIARDLAAGRFAAPEVATVTARSRAASARIAALAICQGTPLRAEIEARDAARLDEVTDVSAEAIALRFGREPVDGQIQAHVVMVKR